MKKLSNVKYELIPSYNDKLKEVTVHYTLDGVPHHYFVFVQKKEKETDKYYLNEAKKKFDADYKSGKVYKSTKIDHSKPWLIAGVSVFGAAAIALGGFFTYKYLTGGFGGGGTYQPGQQVKVNAAVEDPSGGNYQVTFDNNEAKVGEKYHTSINLTPKNPTNDEYVLPDKLVSVISNTTALKEEQYKYTLGENKTTAELDVEGEFVYGPVTISLVLVSTSQPGPGPEPGVWVNTDLDGVLSNRDHILAITETQSPMILIPQILNGHQFVIEERKQMVVGQSNDSDFISHYYIDTDNMYIKQESENLDSGKKTITYLTYRQDPTEGPAVYYCYEDDQTKEKTHSYDYDASTLEQAKDRFNYLYLDNMYSKKPSALRFVETLFYTRPYKYDFNDETGVAKDNLKSGITDYIKTWAEAAPSETVEMEYQKMDSTSIKVSNEKTAPATIESQPCTLSTKYNLLVNNGILLNYANNLTASTDAFSMSLIEECSIKAESFTLDNLDAYFSGK